MFASTQSNLLLNQSDLGSNPNLIFLETSPGRLMAAPRQANISTAAAAPGDFITASVRAWRHREIVNEKAKSTTPKICLEPATRLSKIFFSLE